MRRVAALACALVLVAVAGCGGGGGQDSALPPLRVRTVTPPRPQRLAFLAADRIGVLDDGRVKYVGRISKRETVLALEWSGDGRQLTWLASDPDSDTIGSRLEMVDVVDGSRQGWTGIFGEVDPGLEGVAASSYYSRFAEYLPDGGRRRFSFRLPRPLDATVGISSTSVDAVLPFDDRWLVLAEHASTSGRGGPVRGFLLDPQTGRFDEVADGIGYPAEPMRLGRDDAIWIERRSGSACLSADELGAYGKTVPELPEREDERTWEISRLVTAQGVSVLARGTGQFASNGAGCDGDDTYTWLGLRDGGWVVRERALLDLDLAADGRVARVQGRICEESKRCPESGYLGLETSGATVEDPAGEVTRLPAGTTMVRFSPARPAAAPEYGGSGPELSPRMELGDRGLGPWRMGMAPAELQEGTATPLSFELDSRGCGTVAPTDTVAGEELGVEGELRDGRLTAVAVTTRDRPGEDGEDEDYDPDSLSDLQPGVGSVERRGPLVAGAIRAGDTVDLMVERLGPPAAQTEPSPLEAVDYSYDLGSAVLLAHADGSGTLRRMQVRAASTPAC